MRGGYTVPHGTAGELRTPNGFRSEASAKHATCLQADADQSWPEQHGACALPAHVTMWWQSPVPRSAGGGKRRSESRKHSNKR